MAERQDGEPRPSHFFKAGSRASFLFPSWLSSKHGSDTPRRYLLQRCILHLRLWTNRLFFSKSASNLIHQAYWLAMIEELYLREIDHHQHNWQKSLAHRSRQNQLTYFEQLLAIYDTLQSPSDVIVHEFHTFPEIILVMAKTMTESQPGQPELTQSASQLVQSYQRVRDLIYQNAREWNPPPIRLNNEDPMISKLLNFRASWTQFRCCRSLQIKRQSPMENQALDALSHSIHKTPPQNP